MKPPLISIITVVYNAAKSLQKTIESVAVQEVKNFEYLIIDGGSIDGTVEMIESNYPNTIHNFLSEKDNGLYDAMNKGLLMAKGRFVWFLNAGDTIYDATITGKLGELAASGADILYGETMMVDENGVDIGSRRLKAPEKLKPHSLLNGMLVCHQAILVERSIAPQYNLKWKIAADYDWVLNSLVKSKLTCRIDGFMVRFLDGGINKKNIQKGLKERFSIMILHFGLFKVLIYHILIAVRFFWYLLIHRRF